MKFLITASAALLALSVPAFAAGDAAKGEREFNKCKACHMIQAADGTDIVKGGKTGPNLYGVIGRAAGAQEGFRYGPRLAAAGHLCAGPQGIPGGIHRRRQGTLGHELQAGQGRRGCGRLSGIGRPCDQLIRIARTARDTLSEKPGITPGFFATYQCLAKCVAPN